MSSRFFDRQGNPLTAQEADALLADPGYSRLARHLVRGWTVSTIWLGLDFSHADPDGPPLVFETRILAPSREEDELHPELAGHLVRYPAEEAALAGHDSVLAYVAGELGAAQAEITDARSVGQAVMSEMARPLVQPVLLTPDCPLCGHAPVRVLGGGRQAFCGNGSCDLIFWNALASLEENLLNAWLPASRTGRRSPRPRSPSSGPSGAPSSPA